MKSKLLFLLLLLGSSYITAQTVIENPPFETRQGSIHTISKIELSPTETRLTIRTVFRPQWWTSLDSLTYIYAPESKKQLYPLRIEGRKFGEQVTTPASGIIEDDCVITYPPLARRHYPDRLDGRQPEFGNQYLRHLAGETSGNQRTGLPPQDSRQLAASRCPKRMGHRNL